ncbi:MAG: cation:proton antiporter [Candidatus Micrarchaeia archaeon]
MASMETLVAFGLISGIIMAGFIGEIMFRRLGIPGVLLLLALGYMLGPVTHQLDVNMLKGIEYIVGPLALAILLFDGGLDLNIYRLVHESGRGILMAILMMVTAMLATAGIWMALGYDPLMGAILGAIVGGTTSTIITAIAGKIGISEKAKQFLVVESALTDVLTVVVTIALLGVVMTGTASVQGTGKELASSFSIGGLIGAVLGLIWIALSRKLGGISFSYMLTVAILLFAYLITEYFGASGAIAALMFGIMLGNHKEIATMLRFKDAAETPNIFRFQSEIGFLVRTFYFVYMGTLVSITAGLPVLLGAAVMAGLIVARFVSAKISTFRSDLSQYSKQINIMMPRGLATAVMGSYPAFVLLQSQSAIPANVFAPLYAQALLFVDISFVVIVVSVVLTAAGLVFIRVNGNGEKKEGGEGEESGNGDAGEETEGGAEEGGEGSEAEEEPGNEPKPKARKRNGESA